ncbi:MAG: TlpA family protein disulfide reductase [Myxococcus sp.]|nr:TlpA family protein disulfide reductase [Myxococcus sp.]
MGDEQAPAPPPSRGVQLSNTVIIAGLFAIAAALAVQEFIGGDGLEPGHPAPPLTMTRLDGSTATLSALEGQVVLLNFWATWCPPCNDEMPELVAIARAYEGKGVVFVAANQEDADDARATVGPWLSRHPEVRPYVVLTDPEASAAFLVQALPTTFVINAKGEVVQIARGQVAGWRVKKWLDDALASP